MKVNLRTWIRQKVRDVVDDDETRFRMQLGWVFRILTLVVLVMIVVNTLTREFESIPAMAGFGGISIICALLLEKKPGWKWGVIAAMMAAVLGLFGYFIITGEPEGFSPVWIVLTPSAALLLLGRWNGLKLCAVQFAMLAFLRWTPWGRELLQYPYEESFLLRLPMVYIAAFWISWFLEYVREATQKRLQETQRNLQHLYRHDALTGVMNRHGFNEHMEQVTQRTSREGMALMILDLDDFKQTNDRYGHPAGDEVLRLMAEVVHRVIGSDGEISRWGGEEFAVLMNRAEGARDMAEAMRAAVAAMRVPSGSETVHTTVSIGLTVCPTLPVEKERLLTLTDQCLYRAKKAGKNRCEWTEYTA